MNLQSLIVVVLRLMALNFFLQVAVQLSPQLLQFTEASRQGGFSDMGSFLVVPVIMVIGLAIREEMGEGTRWSEHYRYVPGLHQDDPGHLVLLYFDMPTRWTWHGQPPTIFTERAWIVVPVDFAQDYSRPRLGGGEMSERLTTQQFKQRLGETIEFIRTNARPHWPKIVPEHTKFPESIEHVEK